ncbi:MAG TPA: putative quinol monooxygenase [Thermoanaerobaculia bacterium]|nr:putative quinol monooxygenase [Thermoanaerobaculia bacterium]
MSQGTVHVIATFYAEMGKEDEMERVLREMIEPTRREAGCIRYDLLRSLKGENYVEFVFVEEWASEEELDAHGRSEHLKGLRDRIKGSSGSLPRVIRYRQVG